MQLLYEYKWRAASGLICIVFIYLATWEIAPRANHVYQDLRLLKNERRRLVSSASLEQRLEEQMQKNVRLQEKYRDITSVRSGLKSSSSYLNALQREVSRSGVSLVELHPGEEQVGEAGTALPLGLSLRGRFHQVGQFLSRLEHMPVVVRIRSLEIRRSRTSEEQLAIELSAKIIRLPERTHRNSEITNASIR